ncbi:MAG: hypothetical protein AAGJ52_02945 [Pseudomonadota bacterium]
MLNRVLIMIVVLLLSDSPRAEAVDWTLLQDEIQTAIRGNDANALKQIRMGLSGTDTGQTDWTAYWQAYIAFLLVNLETDEDLQKEETRACKSHSEAAIDAGETSGESHALLSSCLGRMAASGGMMAGMRYGSRSGNALDESILLAPDNPRVLMLAGVSDYNRPVIWGGDIDRAERRLGRALTILEASSLEPDPEQPWLPTWGLHDAFGHYAVVLGRIDREEEALEVLSRAFSLGIQSSWLDQIKQRIESNR